METEYTVRGHIEKGHTERGYTERGHTEGHMEKRYIKK